MGLESGKVYHRYRGGEWHEEGTTEEPGHEPCFHATRTPFRLTVLFFTCMLTFGSYFCFGTLATGRDLLLRQCACNGRRPSL